jgi:hypothetical protein
MKARIEIECTPQEARTFFGQPDVEGLNAFMVEKMKERVEANIEALKPEEMMKNWMSFGGQAQEQFFKLMEAAAGSAPGAPRK